MANRLRWIVGLLLLATPAYGVDFETLVGDTIPSPYEANFKSYIKNQLIPARMAECVSASRPTTYYVDSSVGSTGAGTLAAPLKQISDVNTVINASSGYINVLFRTGKSWNVTTPLLINKDGVKIGTYTTDNVYTPPLLTCFSTAATGSWTSNSDSGSTNDGVATYYRTLASEPGWLVENTSDWTRLTPIRYRDSLADCQATSRSWFWDSGASRLYIHYSADPASIAFAYSLESDADNNGAIEVTSADLTLIEGLRIEGNGCTAITNQTAGYGIVGTASVGRMYVRDCEVYYGGNHCFGSYGGGIVLFQRCRGGYCSNTTGSSTFVFFDDTFTSADECIFDECECMAGHLMHETTSTSLSSVHEGFYGHRNTSGDCGILVAIDCTEPSPMNVTNATATYGSTKFLNVAGDGSTLTGIRALWISHKIDRPLSRCYHGTKEDNGFLGCLWRTAFDTSDTGSWNIGSSAVGGTFVNCIFDFIDYRVTTQRQLIYSTTQKYANCSFHLNGNPANGFYIWPVGSGTPYAGDCVVSKTGAKQVLNGIGASSDYNGDAYWGRTATFGVTHATDYTGWADLSAQVKLTSPLYAGQSPIGTLAETGASSTGPRWDYYWRLRPDTGGSLGAVEANPDVMTETIYQYLQDGVKLRRVNP